MLLLTVFKILNVSYSREKIVFLLIGFLLNVDSNIFNLWKFSFIYKNISTDLSDTHCVKYVQIRSFFWSVFSWIRTEYGDIGSTSPYSVRMRENTDQKKLRIWTLFTQWQNVFFVSLDSFIKKYILDSV